ncbi:hypothetical protein [Streptomyces lancefieldiae]|uniref:Uncharacterized protein n=1 Tax=Streptomyces lancefieldiae TaxID=3075520 RepID=A0ABU3ASA7_9ACTN|nr:hypothetical protein [Streptomyces sp. DSM 40712]MDT0612695.1 hypothetical protein [Streptomyces sp. DSM 40712]
MRTLPAPTHESTALTGEPFSDDALLLAGVVAVVRQLLGGEVQGGLGSAVGVLGDMLAACPGET